MAYLAVSIVSLIIGFYAAAAWDRWQDHCEAKARRTGRSFYG